MSEFNPKFAAAAGLAAAAAGYHSGSASAAAAQTIEQRAERNWPTPPSIEPSTRVRTETVRCGCEGCGKQTEVEFVEVLGVHDSEMFESAVLLSNVDPAWIIAFTSSGERWGDNVSTDIHEYLCFCSNAHVLEHVRKKNNDLVTARATLRAAFIDNERLKRAIEERGSIALVKEFGEDLLAAVREGKIR